MWMCINVQRSVFNKKLPEIYFHPQLYAFCVSETQFRFYIDCNSLIDTTKKIIKKLLFVPNI